MSDTPRTLIPATLRHHLSARAATLSGTPWANRPAVTLADQLTAVAWRDPNLTDHAREEIRKLAAEAKAHGL
jgi:hypothetical protein